MSFQVIWETAIANIGISQEWTIMLMIILGAFIFFAKDFKIGIIILMTTSAGAFIWFYQQTVSGNAMDWTLPLSIFFISLVILSLSIYAVNKSSVTGGFT